MSEVEAVVQRFLEGDEAAFGQLVRQWEAKVYNLAWRYLGNREDAQDVVQEVFFSVFKSLHTLREPKSFPSWLYRITLNHCRTRWRQPAPDLALEDFRDENEIAELNGLAQGCPSRPPPDALETADLIRKAFRGLSDEHRTAIILKEYLGLNLEEVAAAMDCPLSTAKSRLYHGLRAVQRSLRRLGVAI